MKSHLQCSFSEWSCSLTFTSLLNLASRSLSSAVHQFYPSLFTVIRTSPLFHVINKILLYFITTSIEQFWTTVSHLCVNSHNYCLKQVAINLFLTCIIQSTNIPSVNQLKWFVGSICTWFAEARQASLHIIVSHVRDLFFRLGRIALFLAGHPGGRFCGLK